MSLAQSVIRPAVVDESVAPPRATPRHPPTLRLVPLVSAHETAPDVIDRPAAEPVHAAPEPLLAEPVGRWTASVRAIGHGLNWLNHATLGGALSFMEQAQRVLAPVVFVGRHALTLGHAAVLLALPAGAAYALWSSHPVIAEQLAGHTLAKLAYGAGLYLASAAVLMTAGLMVYHLCAGVGRGLAGLARKGEHSFSE